VPCYAKPAKKLTHKDPRWTREGIFLSSVQSLYVVELKLPLRTRLARSNACETHAQPVEKSITNLTPSAPLTHITPT
jgi:hypothetical protein